jgi:hypothetical protein
LLSSRGLLACLNCSHLPPGRASPLVGVTALLDSNGHKLPYPRLAERLFRRVPCSTCRAFGSIRLMNGPTVKRVRSRFNSAPTPQPSVGHQEAMIYRLNVSGVLDIGEGRSLLRRENDGAVIRCPERLMRFLSSWRGCSSLEQFVEISKRAKAIGAVGRLRAPQKYSPKGQFRYSGRKMECKQFIYICL